jgi:hypothetical protein
MFYSPSARNAQRVLSRYLNNKVKVDRAKHIQAVALDGMPRHPPSGNSQEQQMVKMIDASDEITAVDAAVKKLKPKPRKLIRYMYMTYQDKASDWLDLLDSLGIPITDRHWNEYVAVSLEAFAEVYRNGELRESANQNW